MQYGRISVSGSSGFDHYRIILKNRCEAEILSSGAEWKAFNLLTLLNYSSKL